MDKVSKFNAQACALDLLGALHFSDPKIANQMLNARDSQIFDAEWMRVYSAVQDIEVEGERQTKNVMIDELCEWAFKRALAISSHADVAACVADDFDLLARALQADYSDEWLGALWQEYRAGRFPCGDLSR